MQANDPEVSNQEKTTSLNVVKKTFRGVSAQRCCTVHSVRVPRDRNLYLTFTATEKKSVSNCTKKSEVFKSMHSFMNGVNETVEL